MNGYAGRLLNLAVQIRQLNGLAGGMSNHGALFESFAKELESVGMAIEAGLTSPIRDAEAQTLEDAKVFVREGREALASKYHPDSWRLKELVLAANWLTKILK